MVACVRCSGLVKPGEMILILGRPGSGCTTFLKAVANQRDEYSSMCGDVCYGEMDAVETYKGETVYNQDGTQVHL
jgi:ABC-type multidrug transport system ATPase subunit